MSRWRGTRRRRRGRRGRTEFRIKFSWLDRRELGLFRSLSSRPLLFPPPPSSLLAPFDRAAPLLLPPSLSLSRARHWSALVPSPCRLAGARFFPTRSSGIPPLLTAACLSRPRMRANPLLEDAFLVAVLSRFRHWLVNVDRRERRDTSVPQLALRIVEREISRLINPRFSSETRRGRSSCSPALSRSRLGDRYVPSGSLIDRDWTLSAFS